jgi:hypothetical protein
MTITPTEVQLLLIACGVAFLLGACAVAGGLASDWVLRRARRAAIRHRTKMRNRRAER